MNKIKSVTALNNIECINYTIGQIYNGVKLVEITSGVLEYESSYQSIYRGISANGDLIFCFDGLPVHVIYGVLE